MTACGAWFDIQGYIIFVNLFEDPSSDERRRHLRSQGSKRQRERGRRVAERGKPLFDCTCLEDKQPCK